MVVCSVYLAEIGFFQRPSCFGCLDPCFSVDCVVARARRASSVFLDIG